jgi:Bacteriophage protein gp37
MSTTRIEWADAVWNPTVGCTPVSAGCDHCYARRMFNRNLVAHSHKFENPATYPERLEIPGQWKKPRRIFVDSMSDLFHPDIPDKFLYQVFIAMEKCPQHTFMILTKRPERMLAFLMDAGRHVELKNGEKVLIKDSPAPAPANVWLGVTAENQEMADQRILLLLQCPAKVHFVSVEPMLGTVNIFPYLFSIGQEESERSMERGVDWVICGGETGPKARILHKDWVISLRDQCKIAEVPFFFKNWGEWHQDFDHGGWSRVGKKLSGCELDDMEYKEFPVVK